MIRLVALCLLALAMGTHGAEDPQHPQLSDYIWQLGDVDKYAPTGNPWNGGQNLTWCCVKAIAESLEVDVNGSLTLRDDRRDWIGVDSAADLLAYTNRSQFPCTATYVDGDYNGAPVVQVPYAWMKEFCPGWQRSDTSNLNAWLQPLAGFLVPAVIFCLSVPRRRKIAVPRVFFVPDLASAASYLLSPLAALIAGAIVLIDTVIWLSICFAFAGPMILSGVYEAWLDSRVLDFVREKMQNERLTLDMRARLLMLILVGNLDLALDEADATTMNGNSDSKETHRVCKPRESPWMHMEKLLYDIREYDDGNHDRQFAPLQESAGGKAPRQITPDIITHIDQTKTRLRTMLHCQHSFGFVVGAPVIFFLGGFVFALLQSLALFGDEDTALSLAFGQFYMVVPHTAIVSGLLLAGNNPNILEGVFATEAADEDVPLSFLGIRFELAYPSCYKVAWQWQRGNSKRTWTKHLIDTYKTGREDATQTDRDLEYLQERTTLNPVDWTLVLGMTGLLVGVPFLLAFLTAFYTPEIGVSCRSLTVLVYICVQFAQIVLWLWAYAASPDGVPRWPWLDDRGFFTPTALADTPRRRPRAGSQAVRQRPSRPASHFTKLWSAVWYGATCTCGAIAIFAAIGGTLMQLLGVYSADLCNLTTSDWRKPYDQCPMSVISVNSELMIRMARTWWLGCAGAAIGFMVIVSFVAWWYQRRMRDMYTQLVRKIDIQGGFSEHWQMIPTIRAELRT